MKLDEIRLSNSAVSELIEATLSKAASLRFRVKGSSMSPFVKDNDIVTISPLARAGIIIGKPVAFMHPDTKKLAIHRIIGKRRNSYVIKGDAALGIDGRVEKNDILGYVARIERGERIINFGLGPERFLIVFLNKAGLLNFIFWIWRLIPFSTRNVIKNILHG